MVLQPMGAMAHHLLLGQSLLSAVVEVDITPALLDFLEDQAVVGEVPIAVPLPAVAEHLDRAIQAAPAPAQMAHRPGAVAAAVADLRA